MLFTFADNILHQVNLGVHFTLCCAIIFGATLIPKGSWSPKALGDLPATQRKLIDARPVVEDDGSDLKEKASVQ